MTTKIKIHDGILGSLFLFTAATGWLVDPRWMGLTALTAAIMISSAFTGFCPVHYLVGKWLGPDAR
jgi:hypothetical protein